ncbi:hypothetical protein KXQ82_10025 [Mucilaginibacter sp. HMF5004]|uniref:hypothetical protein n=1 Tax=Mucilaginibacter rivuli TaxID=2857527 RepID=UPI001C5D0125|nr:hypothetical protein [Mucilaginibacter rivuli]MBW4890055.1 hypothetical protein [Mucilaginibacter rivuli]
MKDKISMILFLCVFFLKCTWGTSVDHQNKFSNITEIKIINRTTNKFVKRDTTLTKHDDLEKIVGQLKQMKGVPNVNGKKNFGFFELVLSYSDQKSDTFEVVYTAYDGVIIFDENKNLSYKNDELEDLMLQYLK